MYVVLAHLLKFRCVHAAKIRSFSLFSNKLERFLRRGSLIFTCGLTYVSHQLKIPNASNMRAVKPTMAMISPATYHAIANLRCFVSLLMRRSPLIASSKIKILESKINAYLKKVIIIVLVLIIVFAVFVSIVVTSRPKFLFAHGGHHSSAFGASVAVPYAEVLAHAVGAESTVLAAETWDEVGNDAADGEILHALAFAAHDLRDPLPKESRTFVHLTFVGTRSAAICLFPSHEL